MIKLEERFNKYYTELEEGTNTDIKHFIAPDKTGELGYSKPDSRYSYGVGSFTTSPISKVRGLDHDSYTKAMDADPELKSKLKAKNKVIIKNAKDSDTHVLGEPSFDGPSRDEVLAKWEAQDRKGLEQATKMYNKTGDEQYAILMCKYERELMNYKALRRGDEEA